MFVMWFILSCTCFPEQGVMKFVTSNFNFFSFHSCFRLWTHCTLQLFVPTWKDIQHSANGNSTELETSCSHTSNILPKHSVCTESWILEKVLIFAQLFSRHGKGMENGDKVWNYDKKSWGFFFSKLQQVLYKWNFSCWSNLIQSCLYFCSASWKKICSGIF